MLLFQFHQMSLFANFMIGAIHNELPNMLG